MESIECTSSDTESGLVLHDRRCSETVLCTREIKNVHHRKIPNNSNFYLLCIAVLFSLYDLVSTILSAKAVGYSYEGNILIREILHRTGILGFAGVKLAVTLYALFVTYFAIKYKADLRLGSVKMFYGVYAGAIICSAFVATSNLSVVYAGSSFYLLNLNSLQTGIILLFAAPLIGFFLGVQNYSKRAVYTIRKGMAVRAGSRR